MVRRTFSFCCHKGSLIVMFMHVNVSQNTLCALLHVKQAACITGEPGGPSGRKRPVPQGPSLHPRRAQCTQEVLNCFHSRFSPTLRGALQRWKVAEWARLQCISAVNTSLQVTMFRCEDKVASGCYGIKWKNGAWKLYLMCKNKPIPSAPPRIMSPHWASTGTFHHI